MSDALTDIARDQRRGTLFEDYLANLANYLEKPNKKKYKVLKDSAELVDSVPRGYWGGSTSLSNGIGIYIKRLKEGDKTTWGKLLNVSKGREQYNQLIKISPFKDKLRIHVDYGKGFSNIDFGDLESRIHAHLRKKDYRTFDCDKYDVILNLSEADLDKLLDSSEIIWSNCGIVGVKGPRNQKGRLKEE